MCSTSGIKFFEIRSDQWKTLQVFNLRANDYFWPRMCKASNASACALVMGGMFFERGRWHVVLTCSL